MACVLAMITNTTEDYVFDFFKHYTDDISPNLSMPDAAIFLAHHGIFLSSQINNINSKVIDSKYVAIVAFDRNELLISVESEDLPGYEHAIYWDGHSIHDPNPNTKKTKIEDYKVNFIYPLTRFKNGGTNENKS